MKRKEKKQLRSNIEQCIKYALAFYYTVSCHHAADITNCNVCYEDFLKETAGTIAKILHKLSKQTSLTGDFFNYEVCMECQASKYVDGECYERFKKAIGANLFTAVRFLLEVLSTSSKYTSWIEPKRSFLTACLSYITYETNEQTRNKEAILFEGEIR